MSTLFDRIRFDTKNMIFKTKDAFTFATFSAQNVYDNGFTCPAAGTINVFQAYFMIIPIVAFYY